jgi:DNA-binding NarL/FixJ family response regulator
MRGEPRLRALLFMPVAHGRTRDECLRKVIGVSQRSVQLVIGRLLTDADFRRRVQQRGSAYLIRLRTQGVDLSRAEVATLIERDPRVWTNLAKRLDRRSQNGGPTAEREDPEARPLLTKRQQQVLKGVCDGLSNKDIAAQLGVSEGGVKATVQQLFDKASVRRRAQLVRIALEESFGAQ